MLMQKIYKFIRLPLGEKRLFLQAVGYLIYYRMSLKYRDLPKVFGDVKEKFLNNKIISSKQHSIRTISEHIEKAAGYVPFTTCLSKALTGMVMLTRYGYQPTFHIGVARGAQAQFEAHAWLTINDEIVLCSLPGPNTFKEIYIALGTSGQSDRKMTGK